MPAFLRPVAHPLCPAAALAALAALCPTGASAATLSVGPGKTYAKPCAAIAAAKAGDIVEIAAGTYTGDTCSWTTDNLTIRGVGGRPKLDITGTTPSGQKGLFTIYAPNATIENLELMGAAISAAAGNNGAGIRHQGLNLTVRGCYLHDNQNGILGSPSTALQGQVTIEQTEFARNGAGDGYSHNMYLGNYAQFTLRASYSHDVRVGHLVKSRAMTSWILYNRLTDEGGSGSYELDLPNAGTAYVIGNVIAQAPTTQNPTIVSYGVEGVPPGYDTHLYFVGNTVLNLLKRGTFVTDATTTPAMLTDNIFWSGGTITSQASAVLKNNFDSSLGDPRFADVTRYDVHLLAGSPCIDQGALPGSAGGQPLQPTSEYIHPLSLTGRGVAGAAIDIGAYEYLNPGSATGNPDLAGAPGVDAGTLPIDPPNPPNPPNPIDPAPGGACRVGALGGATPARGAPPAAAGLLALAGLVGLRRLRRLRAR